MIVSFFSSCLNNNQLKCIQYPSSIVVAIPRSLFPFSPIFLYVSFPALFPDPCYTHTRFWRFLPLFFSSPLGWCICPFWEEIGSVLANYLLACHLASPFVFSPVLLKCWLDWMVSLFFCRRVDFGLERFDRLFDLSFCLAVERHSSPVHRGGLSTGGEEYHTPHLHQCQHNPSTPMLHNLSILATTPQTVHSVSTFFFTTFMD